MSGTHPAFIEVEINSYCNRRCAWCPNAYSTRGTIKRSMSDAVWRGLLSDLAAHQYAGWFAFHNYNEPLADPTLFDRIREVHATVPRAKSAVYTNGDFRKKGEFQRLISIGVHEIRVTLYPTQEEAHLEPGWKEIRRFIDDVVPQAPWHQSATPIRNEGHLTVGRTKFIVIRPRIEGYNNRAGSIEASTDPAFTRVMPCFMPSWAAAIDVDGNLKLCCQIYDATGEAGEPYRIGNVGETPFFQLWYSQRFMEIRRRLAAGDMRGRSACGDCNHKMREADEREARALFTQLNSMPRGATKVDHG